MRRVRLIEPAVLSANQVSAYRQLYAEIPTVGDWMYSLPALRAALRRGWIVQETSYGPLDEVGMAQLLQMVRDAALDFVGCEWDLEANKRFLKLVASPLTQLLTRRGFGARAKESEVLRKYDEDFFRYRIAPMDWAPTVTAAMMYMLNNRHAYGCDNFDLVRSEGKNKALEEDGLSSLVGLNVLFVFTDLNEPRYRSNLQALLQVVAGKGHANLASFEQFTTTFGSTLVSAYLNADLTFEGDRYNAVTQVPLSIARSYGVSMSRPSDMVLVAWAGVARDCEAYGTEVKLKVNDNHRCRIVFFQALKDTLRPGNRFGFEGKLGGTEVRYCPTPLLPSMLWCLRKAFVSGALLGAHKSR